MSITVKRRPPVYEAMQWDGTKSGAEKLASWCGHIVGNDFPRDYELWASNNYKHTRTLVIYLGSEKTGSVYLSPGAWMLHGDSGFEIPLTNEEFLKQFEEVNHS